MSASCRKKLYGAVLSALFATTAYVAPVAGAPDAEEYDEFVPIVEINATDGDVGFHVLLDGEGWSWSRVWDPLDDLLFKAADNNALREQGLTEIFFESAEPLCWDDGEEEYEDDDIVTVAQFLERFPAGEYRARGRTIEKDLLLATGLLTHELPAAPLVEVELMEDVEDEEYDVVIRWREGDDLGNCGFDDAMITPPGEVDVVRWEIVVEPDEDALEEMGIGWPDGLPFSVFMVQLPDDEDKGIDEVADMQEIEVPDEYLAPYLDAGIIYFKFEVGAREESGNQTFTEDTFTVSVGL